MGNRNANTHADGARIADWIALFGNQTSAAIACRFRFEKHYAMLCLRSALLDGNLVKVRMGPKYLWALPGDAKKLHADGVELSRAEKLRKRAFAAKSEFDGDPGNEPFTHSVVPAIGAPPIKISFATSIFNMVTV